MQKKTRKNHFGPLVSESISETYSLRAVGFFFSKNLDSVYFDFSHLSLAPVLLAAKVKLSRDSCCKKTTSLLCRWRHLRCMHPLKTFVALYKWRKNSSNAKRRQLKLGTYLAKLIPIKYLGPHKMSTYTPQLSLS